VERLRTGAVVGVIVFCEGEQEVFQRVGERGQKGRRGRLNRGRQVKKGKIGRQDYFYNRCNIFLTEAPELGKKDENPKRGYPWDHAPRGKKDSSFTRPLRFLPGF